MFFFPLSNLADIDECALAAVTGLQACQGGVLCTNSPGSFTCSCPTGYIMAPNGQSCVGEDGANGWCVRLRRAGGLYPAGTEGGNSVCGPRSFSPDIDECILERHCRTELGNVCVNTPGSFVCQCLPGFRAEAPACVGETGVHLRPLASPSSRVHHVDVLVYSFNTPPRPALFPCSQVLCVLISRCVKVRGRG